MKHHLKHTEPHNAKEAYEQLLLLYVDLCRLDDINQFPKLLNELSTVISYVRKFYFFPVFLPLSEEMRIGQMDKPTEKDREQIARLLYEWVARLVLRFEEANIVTMRPYIDLLEYGRACMPDEHAVHWGEDFCESSGPFNERFYFNSIGMQYRLRGVEYCEHAKQLREDSSILGKPFPKEKRLSQAVYSQMLQALNEAVSSYQSYIEENYASIKYLFKYYNKHIRLYVHPTKKDSWTALMNIYNSTSSECFVYPNEVNVMYRFYNIEANSQKISDGWLMGLNGKKISFDNICDIKCIHTELNRLYIKYASAHDVLWYMIYMLRGAMCNVVCHEADNVLIINGSPYILCLKDNFTIRDISEMIASSKGLSKGIIFRFVPTIEIQAMLKKAQMSFLCVEQRGRELIDNDSSMMIHWYIKEHFDSIKNVKKDSTVSAELLRRRLEQCPKGKMGWAEYENIGVDIFKYLFENDFRKYKTRVQYYTENKIHRRDLIVDNIYKSNAIFWKSMAEKFSCTCIIVDFKNYSMPLNSHEAYIVTQYLNNQAGHFAILFSRRGLSAATKKHQLVWLKDKGEMVLCVDDKDVLEMLRMKDQNQCPADVLENMYCALCSQ